jgi:hypothetical protein
VPNGSGGSNNLIDFIPSPVSGCRVCPLILHRIFHWYCFCSLLRQTSTNWTQLPSTSYTHAQRDVSYVISCMHFLRLLYLPRYLVTGQFGIMFSTTRWNHTVSDPWVFYPAPAVVRGRRIKSTFTIVVYQLIQ